MNHGEIPAVAAGDPGGMGRSGPQTTGDRPPRSRRPFHPAVNLACFLLTCFSTLIAGTLMTFDGYRWTTIWDVIRNPPIWGRGSPYAIAVLLILGAHEMGHFIACRYYRIDASWPFFLPAPHLFGTFGAVIRIRAPITDRRALFDIGVAGPLAGFVVAVPVLLLGLARSTAMRGAPLPGELILATPLLLDLLYPLYFPVEPGVIVRLDPLFMAAWLGLFATALNLLPIAQLDGGHMLYAVSRRLHRAVSRAGVWVLCLGGVLFGGWHLVTFGLLFAIVGPGHPPLIDETAPIGRGRQVIALLALIVFVLCFIGRNPLTVLAS